MKRRGLDFGRFCCFVFLCVCFVVAGFGFVCSFLVWWGEFCFFFFKAQTLKEELGLKYRHGLKQVFYA